MRRLLSLAAVGALLIASALGASALQATSVLGAPRTPPAAAAQRGAGTGTTRSGPPRLPGERLNVLSTIQGDVLNSINGKMPDAEVRLRDARSGRIVEVTMSDKSGAFAFHQLDPGSYVVELLGPRRRCRPRPQSSASTPATRHRPS